MLSGGVRQLYYKDNQFFPIGSITIAEFYPLTNYYRMGLGVDAFYDSAFGEVNASLIASENETKYQRTYIASDLLSNKIRAGISWQHELIIGKTYRRFPLWIILVRSDKKLRTVHQRFKDNNQKTNNLRLQH